MSSARPSPREEALSAILLVREQIEERSLTPEAWEKLVALAWDNRAHAGDRRDIRRAAQAIIAEDLRRSGVA